MAGESERLVDALSLQRLEPFLQRLAFHAELSEPRRLAFIEWAHAIRERLLHPPSAGLAGFRESLESVKQEYRAVHAGVAAGWLASGHIDEELVCRRSFLGHVIDTVGPEVGAEPPPSRLVKAAA